GGGAKRIVARFETRPAAVEGDAERFVLGAAALQAGPVAGREWNAIAVVDVPARDLARDGIQARVVLRALHAVFFEGFRVEREVEAEACLGAHRCTVPARNEKSQEHEDGGNAEEAPLFADRGQDEVGIAGWNQGGVAPAGAGSRGAAGGERPERVSELVAAV